MAEIAFRGLAKDYGRTPALREIDLEVARGEFVVILGPSGCGKSTLLRLLAGLERATRGRIELGGEDVTARGVGERDVAMVFQNYALYPHMTVAENLGYALKVARVPKAERRARVDEVAHALQIDALLDRRPGQLSGGQRQRVAMGRAIIRRPRAFLFDEPLSNLDAKLRVQMRLEIKRLHRAQGATSLFVTHDQVEAMTLADRLVIMNGGRIEQVGPPGELYHQPESAFCASFLGSPPMTLIPARLAEDRRAVLLADGRRLSLEGAAEAEPGAAVELGVRPEHVRLGAPGGLELAVEFVEELGSGRLVHLLLGDATLAATLGPDDDRPLGRVVPVELRADRLALFDAATGRALSLRREAEPAPRPRIVAT